MKGLIAGDVMFVKSIPLAIILLLSGCASYGIGVSVHIDSDEYFENPIGIVRGSTQFNDYSAGFCEQLILNPKMIGDVIMINHCGVMFNF